jgi:hypothetical protein
MTILSWDVGVLHLAYCIIHPEKDKLKILDWNNINLLHDPLMDLHCCGTLKNELKCTKKALYYLSINPKKGFCKNHLHQAERFLKKSYIKKFFKKKETEKLCQYSRNSKTICKMKGKYLFRNQTICRNHYKLILKNEFLPKPIKKTVTQKIPTSQIQLALIKELDSLMEHFNKMKIDEVVIENQPTFKNPKMKSIANTLYDFFLIRGLIDKEMNIKILRFIAPSNKLKLKGLNLNNKKYKITKELSVKYTKQLLEEDPVQLEYLNLFEKQDDLCDSFLQGKYYYENLRKKMINQIY